MRKLSPGGHWGTHTALTFVPRKYPPVSQTQLALSCVRTKREPCTHTFWKDNSAESNGSQRSSSKQCVLVIEIRSWDQTLTQGGQDMRPHSRGSCILKPPGTKALLRASALHTSTAAQSGRGQLPAVHLTPPGRPRPCHREAPLDPRTGGTALRQSDTGPVSSATLLFLLAFWDV